MEFGISNDVAQPIFFGFAGLIGLLVVWFIFIRKDETFDKRYRAFAQRTGLAFTPPVSVGRMTVGIETSVLEGQLNGVPVRLVAEYQANSRRAGVNGRSTFSARALAPAPITFGVGVELAKGGPPAAGGVPTGDIRFDVSFCVRSDQPRAAAALLDANARAALLARPSAWGPCTIRYDRGAITVEMPDFPYEEAQLDYGFRLLVSLGCARLS